MARKALQSEDLGEDEVQPAPKLLEVILQNCRGRVDQYLPLYIQASLLHVRCAFHCHHCNCRYALVCHMFVMHLNV